MYIPETMMKSTHSHTHKKVKLSHELMLDENLQNKKNNEKLTQKKSIFKFEDFLRRLFAEYH